MNTPGFTPPRLAMKFFRAVCKPDYLEEIEGDLVEIYEQRSRCNSLLLLKWLFVLEVFLLIRPKLLRSFVPKYLNPLFMFKDHLKISFRNLFRQRSYTIINTLGLSLGISAAILLYLVVDHELSYDRFHQQADQIYRLGEKPAEGVPYYQTKIPLAPKLKEDLPEVVLASRFMGWESPWIETKNGRAKEVIHYADADFAEMFTFPATEGNFIQALSSKGHLAITEKAAQKLFGNEPAVGKEVREIQSGKIWIVGAVLKDVPVNSSLQFTMLAGWVNIPEELAGPAATNWYDTYMTAYVALDDHTNPGMLRDKLEEITRANFLPHGENNTTIQLLPLAELRRVNSNNEAIINLLGIVAIIILAIASVNFINLSTAQSLARVKEVSVRKVLGSSRINLVSQLLTEAFLVNALSAVAAWGLLSLAVPVLEEKFSIDLTLNTADWLMLIIGSFAFSGVLGLVSGLVPAWFITAIKPAEGLKGNAKTKGTNPLLRNGLLTFQFAASIFMLAGTLLVWKQINYMKEQDLNFDDEQVVVVPVWRENFTDGEKATRGLKLLVNEYQSVPAIESVSFGENVPGRHWHSYNSFGDANAPGNKHSLRQASVSPGYFATLGVKFLHGRDFDPDLASDSAAVIINRKAMAQFGWDNIEGKQLCEGGQSGCGNYKVIGVIEDFHYQSLESSIEPFLHFQNTEYFNYMLVRFTPGRTREVLARLEQDYQALQPLQSFDYFFLDQEFASMYKSQERIGISAGFFSVLAVIIASLGLFSVASFIIRRKRKEISIRKVMGATVWQLAGLLTKTYVILVAVACAIAIPAAYWLMEGFLEDFAYRIRISPLIFVISGMVVLLFAVVSISLIVFRASKENPVLALRNE